MIFEIDTVSIDEKEVLKNLLELYIYDFTEFQDIDVKDDGRFGYKYLDNYWTEPGRFAYLVRVNSQLAGFVMVRKNILSDSRECNEIAEFFILKKYRRHHLGKRVATKIFGMFQGIWKVSQLENNFVAIKFWKNVISEYTGDKYEVIRENDWKGPIFIFGRKG